MDINKLITIVKNKLLNQINIESINIEDKSFLHKNHKGNQEGKYHLKLIIVSEELKLCVGLCQVISDFKKSNTCSSSIPLK